MRDLHCWEWQSVTHSWTLKHVTWHPGLLQSASYLYFVLSTWMTCWQCWNDITSLALSSVKLSWLCPTIKGSKWLKTLFKIVSCKIFKQYLICSIYTCTVKHRKCIHVYLIRTLCHIRTPFILFETHCSEDSCFNSMHYFPQGRPPSARRTPTPVNRKRMLCFVTLVFNFHLYLELAWLAQLVSTLGQWSKGPWFETRIGQSPYFEPHYYQLVCWCQYNVTSHP
jgi:hypothetical protein